MKLGSGEIRRESRAEQSLSGSNGGPEAALPRSCAGNNFCGAIPQSLSVWNCVTTCMKPDGMWPRCSANGTSPSAPATAPVPGVSNTSSKPRPPAIPASARVLLPVMQSLHRLLMMHGLLTMPSSYASHSC